ncbi:DUF3465 domain-containing protein [Desulfonema magnum]|uniref:DUF3465 n=1 Tax=Desulfonema magnum TaxID=45655 RepID=A0A975GTK3_9BACT|nr:DUF3465 domain-containing protein [Desulfonema magnum]QTA93176.1 DUF3465 [Desulfonema magnum]
MKKLFIIIAIGFVLYGFCSENLCFADQPALQNSAADLLIKNAFNNKQSDLQVKGVGKVIKILPDDLKGSRHQRFIIRLAWGQTLLIAHNIDIAPKINALRKGDKVEFYGEYEWSKKGGVIHWTHHDPKGRHENGWLKHEGTLYR